MTKALTELAGKEYSTFMRWSSLLGNATVNRFYSLDQNPNREMSKHARTLRVIQIGGRRFVNEEYWQQNEKHKASAPKIRKSPNNDGRLLQASVRA
jgi:hypothetical protein